MKIIAKWTMLVAILIVCSSNVAQTTLSAIYHSPTGWNMTTCPGCTERRGNAMGSSRNGDIVVINCKTNPHELCWWIGGVGNTGLFVNSISGTGSPDIIDEAIGTNVQEL